MADCYAHRFHSPRPQTLVTHQVLPEELGGPGAEEVALCPTGHENVHELLRAYRDLGQTPPWPFRRQFGPGERQLAAEGWRLYREAVGARG